jgi:phosphoribosylglycinamide formyltransferase-1
MFKIAAVVSGGGSNLQAIIDAIQAGHIKGTEIALVVSTNHHAYALKRAEQHGIPAVVFAKKDFADLQERENALADLLKSYKIDLLVLCGSLMVFSEKFITNLAKPIINIHPALLPAFGGKGFYGIRVHEAVLAAEVATTGATVHYVDGGVDTGDIILQKEVAVLPNDTPESLQRRVMEEAEWQILPQVIQMFAEGLFS